MSGSRCRLLVAALSSLSLVGCVERFVRIETEPVGAIVIVNGDPMGPSPVEMPFQHYGVYRVDTFHRGYQPDRREVAVERPWYQWFPFDLFAELLDPRTHVDRHQVSISLDPVAKGEDRSAEAAELWMRAQAAKEGSR